MPPPSLFTTTIVRSSPWRRTGHRPLRSCRKERSPITSTTRPCRAAAAPTAVETTPSMPEAPRVPSTRTSRCSTGRKESASRTGMLFPSTSVEPSGSIGASSAGTRPSNGSTISSRAPRIAKRAALFASTHSVRHAGPARSDSLSAAIIVSQKEAAPACTITEAVASGSRQRPAASTTTEHAPWPSSGCETARYCESALEVGAAPKRITASGRARAANRGSRTSESAVSITASRR